MNTFGTLPGIGPPESRTMETPDLIQQDRTWIARVGLAFLQRGILVLAFCGLSASGQLITNTYQNGLNSYTAAHAIYMRSNGITESIDDGDGLVQQYADDEAHVLLLFDDLDLGPGPAVRSATLRVSFDHEGFNPEANVIAGRYLKSSWNHEQVGDNGVNWRNRDLGAPWSRAGALGDGTDLVPGKQFIFDGFSPAEGTETKIIPLDPALVQRWSLDPSSNQGILLVEATENQGLRVYGPSHPNAELRPQLTIVYQPGEHPTIVQQAAANPSQVNGRTSQLTVLGADALGETGITYTWSAEDWLGPVPTFDPNGDNAAKTSVVTFSAAGDYTFIVEVKNSLGLTASSAVGLSVLPVFSGIRISSETASIKILTNATRTFVATALDQFGAPLPAAAQPAFAWSIQGEGTIDLTGRFTAGSATGAVQVVAAANGLRAALDLKITLPNKPPTVEIIAPASDQTCPFGKRA